MANVGSSSRGGGRSSGCVGRTPLVQVKEEPGNAVLTGHLVRVNDAVLVAAKPEPEANP